MSATVFVYGSINVDEVFTVPHILVSGETLSSTGYERVAGGKGANQSVAAALAGSKVIHAGKVGRDGGWIRQLMANKGVNVDLVLVDNQEITGRAIIQVSQTTGDNSIILFGGTNKSISYNDITQHYIVHESFSRGNWLVIQNEVSNGDQIMREARKREMIIVFNPAPMCDNIMSLYPFECVDILILNETEAIGLYSQIQSDCEYHQTDDLVSSLQLVMEELMNALNISGIIITLGEHGVIARFKDLKDGGWLDFRLDAVKSRVIDTTGAGDTFVGYFVATMAQLTHNEATSIYKYDALNVALNRANLAASIACSSSGAMESIPSGMDVHR